LHTQYLIDEKEITDEKRFWALKRHGLSADGIWYTPSIAKTEHFGYSEKL
jgi:hypothetical protein